MPDQLYQKTCTKCAELKTADNFVRCSESKDGLHWWCKSCFRSVRAEREKIRNAQPLAEPDPSKYRECARCKASKPETEFARERVTRHGFNYTCKDCVRRKALMRTLARLEPIDLLPGDVQIDRINPAYAAGLFDGEGCVSISKVNSIRTSIGPYYTLNVAVFNTFIEPLLRLERTYGGSVVGRKDHETNGWKQCYRWRAASWGAVAFLNDVMPFLIIKRKQAEIAIELQQNVRHTGNRWGRMPEAEREAKEKLYQQLRKLNERGPRHARPT